MSLKKAIGAAVRLYESFREESPRKVGAVRVNIPQAVAVMGYVEGIDYRTTHGRKLTLYHHDFEPGSRPLLAVSADGTQLLLLGGRYQFTEQGIVDKDARGNLITNPKHGKSINPRRSKLEKFLGRKRKGNPATLSAEQDAALIRYATLREAKQMRAGKNALEVLAQRTETERAAFKRHASRIMRLPK